MAEPLLELCGVEKRFGDFAALKGVSLTLAAGSVTCLVGPSGSGKSTLLRTVNLLETIDGGGIYLRGEMLGFTGRGDHRRPVPKKVARRQAVNFGMVFQSFNLIPQLTATENVALGPVEVLGTGRAAARGQARELLGRVGLAQRCEHYPAELSGGQQQRVAIARALAMKPSVLLFDEPTSALDAELVAEVLAVIRELAKEGYTMLIVTHELAFARDIADEVIMMDEGRIVESGPPAKILLEPETERAKRFFASVQH
ncbi:amino acid ABC transporter ATP-binding protein [Amycolatopsis jiangsuensis]|uniref:Polar amino acid transport system ATP-binding protein n=1 Tax=Amycolatopsis jiangsuensis TaxID=1181879 RepID=A0A840INZ5_9PSEU|nr:amino acid ABC transporter ATP-binding protein [Amycolatopsis jiangsuensis]MBB4684086.1 polar amino acid transport system ATP-binding protein [Amycolatopsis jiangsuensis]